jgi:hypothetical protein
MEKKLFILMLVVAFLPSSAFAGAFLDVSAGLSGSVSGNISPDGGVSGGGAGTELHLWIDDINLGRISGASQGFATGGFTALGNGIVNLQSGALFDWGARIDDSWMPQNWDLYPNSMGSEFLVQFSRTLVSPDQTITQFYNQHVINVPDTEYFDVCLLDTLPPITLPFEAGERGSWILDTLITGTVYAPTLEPIPEPSTMLLFGSGLIGLVGYGRKKLFKK